MVTLNIHNLVLQIPAYETCGPPISRMVLIVFLGVDCHSHWGSSTHRASRRFWRVFPAISGTVRQKVNLCSEMVHRR
jgi:hypothetical protein